MIRKTIKGGDFKSQMVGELVFDQVPEEGSFNPVTSEGVAKAINEYIPEGTSESNPLMNAADTEFMIAEMMPIAAKTLRFCFSKADYDPTIAGVGSVGTWKKVTKYCNIWDWTNSGTSFASAFNGAFADSENLVSVIKVGDTSEVTAMNSMFYGCTSLTRIPLFDTSAVTNMSYMFSGCNSLVGVPLFDTSAATSMSFMFYNCYSLKNIPLFDTSLASSTNSMFSGCKDVEEGSLALYQQASTQTTPPTSYSNMFSNCGINTETGAAELAQIPASWGGTAS